MTDQPLVELERHFQLLASGSAALRRWQQQYTTLLDAAHAAELADLTARYAAQRRASEARRQAQRTTADAVLAQESAAIYSLWQQAAATPDWAATRWAQLTDVTYAPPAPDAAPAERLRIGALQMAGDPGHWDLPALAPLLSHGSLVIDARHSPDAAAAG